MQDTEVFSRQLSDHLEPHVGSYFSLGDVLLEQGEDGGGVELGGRALDQSERVTDAEVSLEEGGR